MDDSAKNIDIEKLISYSDDLVEVLKNKKDVNSLEQCMEGSKMLQSQCEADFFKVQKSLEEYQKKIHACRQRIDEAKSEIVADEDLESLQKELEEELQRERLLQEELRIVNDEISDLERQMVSVEERKEIFKKLDKDELRLQRELSMYASVTNIIPNLDDQSKISGHIVERDKRIVEKFEFDPEKASASEICDSLWKMISL